MPDAVFVHQVSSLASFFQIPPCDGHPCLAMRLVLPPLRSRLSPIKSAHAKHTTNGQWGLGFSRTPYCIRSLIFDGEKTSQAFSDNSCTINTFVPFCCVSALSYRASRLVLSGWHHFISLYRKRKERLGKVRFEAITHKRMTNEIICSVVASEDFNFFPF